MRLFQGGGLKGKDHLQAQRKFTESFSKRVNEAVTYMSMAELKADRTSLERMGLSAHGGADSIWGIIIVCEKSVYFYAPAHELLILSMVRVGTEGAVVSEQMFCFNGLTDLRLFAPQRKWYQLFMAEKIVFSFLIDGHSVQGELYISRNSAETLLKMRSVLNM